MNKVISYTIATLVAACSVTAMACPQGTSLQGGTGPNHKGGKCVLISKSQVKAKMNTTKATASKSLSDSKAASKTSLKNTTQQSKELSKQKLATTKTNLNSQTSKLSNSAKQSSTAGKQQLQQKTTQLKQAKSNVIGSISQ